MKIVGDPQPHSPIIGGIVVRAPNDDPLGQDNYASSSPDTPERVVCSVVDLHNPGATDLDTSRGV
jgi:hypothetical protein